MHALESMQFFFQIPVSTRTSEVASIGFRFLITGRRIISNRRDSLRESSKCGSVRKELPGVQDAAMGAHNSVR